MAKTRKRSKSTKRSRSRSRGRATGRKRAAPKRKSSRRKTSRRKAPRRRSRTKRASARRSSSARKSSRRKSTRRSTRRRPSRRNPKLKLPKMKDVLAVAQDGAVGLGGYAAVNLFLYGADQVGLSKVKAKMVEKNPTSAGPAIVNSSVRLLGVLLVSMFAARAFRKTRHRTAAAVGGAISWGQHALEDFVLDTEWGQKLPAPARDALSGYDGFDDLFCADRTADPSLYGVDGGAGVGDYLQHEPAAGGMAGYLQQPDHNETIGAGGVGAYLSAAGY